MGFSSRLKAHRHLLTLETLKFIVAYLESQNATQAALDSGIPALYASRQGQWLKKLPFVKAVLEGDEISSSDMKKLKTAVIHIDRLMDECKSILGLP